METLLEVQFEADQFANPVLFLYSHHVIFDGGVVCFDLPRERDLLPLLS